MGHDPFCTYFTHTLGRPVVDLLVHLESRVSILHHSGNPGPTQRQVIRDGSELDPLDNQQHLWASVHSRGH